MNLLQKLCCRPYSDHHQIISLMTEFLRELVVFPGCVYVSLLVKLSLKLHHMVYLLEMCALERAEYTTDGQSSSVSLGLFLAK